MHVGYVLRMLFEHAASEFGPVVPSDLDECARTVHWVAFIPDMDGNANKRVACTCYMCLICLHSTEGGFVVDELSKTLRAAYDAVTEAGIPERLEEAAFREAMRILAPPPVNAPGRVPPVVPPALGKQGPDATDAVPDVTEDEMYARVVDQTGVDRDKLEQLVHLDNSTPKITLSGMKLGKNNAEKARVVAQVLTIVRGFGLGENDTALEVVRGEVVRLKCYDSANFTAQLSKLDGFVITGSGQNRRIRAKSNGIQSFAALVDRLVGEA